MTVAGRLDGGSDARPLHVRWLGTVRYRDAHALQHGLFSGSDDWLLLLEHPHVYTLGVRADPAHVLVDPAAVGAEVVATDRGGDVTYHGPGQLVGYPILSLPGKGTGSRGTGMADTVAYVRAVEQVLIDALGRLGLVGAGRLREYPGVWVDPEGPNPRKIAAVGVRLSRGRSMHGFALNVDPDMGFFEHIVPCGIVDKPVTSLRAEGLAVSMREVVDAVAAVAAATWAPRRPIDRADLAWRVDDDDLAVFSRRGGPGLPREVPSAAPAGTSPRAVRRLDEAGVTDGLTIGTRKPPWLRAPVRMTPGYATLRGALRDLELVTVCEEAGCPNIYECWSAGTATFMINGDRCTRACGFCLVDTRRPLPPDPAEPARVAAAVRRLGLRYAVITAVARDDLPDGGAEGFVETVRAVRSAVPGVTVEVLIPDCRGAPDALDAINDVEPDVVNHNIETVLRLQRAVRPSAGYARSLAVLARAKAAGRTTKSGLLVGLGERDEEVVGTLADLAGVGVDIVTIGQYLRPTTHHLPVHRWVDPARFEAWRDAGEELGIGHVEAGPLVRSSYHAADAAAHLGPSTREVDRWASSTTS